MVLPTPSFDARMICKTVFDMVYAGSTVHIACTFSIIELMALLQRNQLRYPAKIPLTDGRPEFAPVRVLLIGVQDRFSKYYGNYEYLLKEHELDRKAIERRVSDFFAAK